MTAHKSTTAEAAALLRLDDVAELLDVHVVTVRRWIAAGQLRALRAGRTYRVRLDDLAAFTGGTVDDLRSRWLARPSAQRRRPEVAA